MRLVSGEGQGGGGISMGGRKERAEINDLPVHLLQPLICTCTQVCTCLLIGLPSVDATVS